MNHIPLLLRPLPRTPLIHSSHAHNNNNNNTHAHTHIHTHTLLTTHIHTQFAAIGSEVWFLSMSVDLFVSFRSPFSDFKRHQRENKRQREREKERKRVTMVGRRQS